MDEKQVHLVKQVSGQINNLWTFQDYLPWNLVLLRRLFSHQNQAIAKSSLIQFMKTFEIDHQHVESVCFQEFIKDSLLVSLNNPKYYDTNELFESLKEFLKKSGSKKVIFWNFLLAYIIDLKWAPIPLFHCLRALTDVSEDIIKMKEFKIDLKKLTNFLLCGMNGQEPLIRGAAQECLLRTLINISDSKNLFGDDNLEEFLKCFQGPRGILIRGTNLYNEVFKWVGSFPEISCPKTVNKIFYQTDSTEELIENICKNAFRLYSVGDIEQDICKFGILIDSLTKPKIRKGREHLEFQQLMNSDFIENQNIIHSRQTELAEIIISTLNKPISKEHLEKKLAILEHFCGFESFSFKYEETLKNLNDLTLTEIVFVSHFVSQVKSLDLSDNIVRKKFPKIPPDFTGADNSLHLSCQWKIVKRFLDLTNKGNIEFMPNNKTVRMQ